MSVFNAAEAIDLGIEKEKRRMNFYRRTAEKFKDKSMRDLFTRLKTWEGEHVKKFSEIREAVEEDETFESYAGELENYMKSLIDDKFYRDVSPAKFSAIVKTPLDAIRYGMIFEKDAILFFSEIMPNVNPENRDKIRLLIEEEKKHLIYLAQLKSKFK